MDRDHPNKADAIRDKLIKEYIMSLTPILNSITDFAFGNNVRKSRHEALQPTIGTTGMADLGRFLSYTGR